MTLASSGKTTSPRPTSTVPACPNCGEVGTGRTRYCVGCGQRVGVNQLTVRAFVAEILNEVFSLSGRLPTTLWALFTRPGHLTREFVAGRIVRYVRPFRLYLVSSVIFFLALSLTIRLNADPAKLSDRIEVQEPAAGTTSESKASTATNEDSLVTELTIPSTLPDTDGAAAARSEDNQQSRTPAPITAAAGSASFGTDEVQQELSSALPGEKAATKPVGKVEQMLYPFIEAAREDPSDTFARLVDRLLRDVPKAIFVLLPLFALFLKLLYIRQHRLYVEHLVFVFHIHAFAFLVAAVLLLLPSGWSPWYVWLLIPAYVFLAMRRVYEQSLMRTALYFFIFGWMYTFSVFTTLLAVVAIAAVTLGTGTVAF